MAECAVNKAMLEDVEEREKQRQAAILRADEALKRLKPEETAARLEAELQRVQKQVTDLRQVTSKPLLAEYTSRSPWSNK